MVADWNAVRFASGCKDHVESYFLKANDPAGDKAVWIKATIFASSREPGRVLSEGWAIFFDRTSGKSVNVAVKSTRPFSDTSFSGSGLDISWPDFSMKPGSAKGSIEMREHAISWDLASDGELSPVVPFFSPRMYEGSFPKSKTVTPYPKLAMNGTVTVDGTTHELRGWRGMQGHNWGRGHADLYAWSQCNLWDHDEDFILEAFSGRVRVGPIMTPLITIVCARHRGVRYDFNRPIQLARARGDVTPRAYTFSARSGVATIEGLLEAPAEDMVGLHYANPDGQMTYCLNSKLASARIRFEASGRAPLELTSRSAALEVGTRDDGHGVHMYV